MLVQVTEIMEILFGVCYLSLGCLHQISGESNTYRGAVVEYHPVLAKDEESRVELNVANYVTFMKLAKEKGADIIVFPENGLLTKDIQSPIPDPSDQISPCDSTFETSQAVKTLSCASKSNRIYSVVNLLEKRTCIDDDAQCPLRGYYIYNTNIAFDRMGVVVARYPKFNIYDEPLVNKTKHPEMAIFDTDFDVRFGMFTCFDILFGAPALRLVYQFNVTDFVFTSHWYSELPFLTSLQVQRGWAETNNINLLASGVNYPPTATFGSGIYHGKEGDLIQIMPEVVTNKLLIADIPKIKTRITSGLVMEQKSKGIPSAATASALYSEIVTPFLDDFEKPKGEVKFLRDHMQLFESEVIDTRKKFERKICSKDGFCCYFHVSVETLSSDARNYTPRAVVFNGVRKFGMSFRGGVQCCAVVICNGPDVMNCTSLIKKIPGVFKFNEIQVRGNFMVEDSFQIPTTLTVGERLEPLTSNKYEFRKNRKGNSIEVSIELVCPTTNLQAFGIWGRDFTRDLKSNAPAAMSTSSLFMVYVLAAVFGLKFLSHFSASC